MLIDDIREIVHDHSGGLKFTELQAELITTKDFHGDFGAIETIIRESKDLGIFDYSWHMNGMTRHKMFVYEKD